MTTRARLAESSSLSESTLVKMAIAIFVAACFFPYPALALGANTGLQISFVLALAAVPLMLLAGLSPRAVIALALLIGPQVFSAAFNLIGGNTLDPTITTKSLITLMLALAVIVPGGNFARRAYFPSIAAGASVAIIVHSAAGWYQLYSFKHDVFPFLSLYRNPSFASLQSVSTVWATYIQRPFGLFPEPSAMAASIGPWLILLAGVVLRPDLRDLLSPRLRRLAIVAVLAGTSLVILSRSGYAIAFIIASAPVLLLAPGPNGGRQKTGMPTALKMTIAAIVLAVTAYFAVNKLGSRLALQQNDSWQVRGQSLVLGLWMPTQHLSTFLFGVGPGQSHLMLTQSVNIGDFPSWYRPTTVGDVDAVWSLTVRLYMEAGILGLTGFGLVIAIAVRAIRNAQCAVLGYATGLAWLIGTTVATSYLELSPIWLFLALLLHWDEIFGCARAVAPVQPRQVASPQAASSMKGVSLS